MQYHVLELHQSKDTIKVSMVRGNIRTGMSCYVIVHADTFQPIDCTFNLDTVQCRNMVKEARRAIEEHLGVR